MQIDESQDAVKVAVAACVLHWGDDNLTSRCVASLQAQRPPVSVVVVSNGSPWRGEGQDSVEAIATSGNLGYTGGMNVGLQWAIEHGFDVITLITNDAWLPDVHAVRNLVSDLVEDERIAATGPRFFHHQADGSLLEAPFPVDQYPSQVTPGIGQSLERFAPHLTHTALLGGTCLTIRTSALEDVGLFDERLFMYFDEVDWCYRTLIGGWQLCRDERVSCFEEMSASSSRVLGLKEYYMTRNRLSISRRYRGPMEVLRVSARAVRMAAGMARRQDPRWPWVVRGAIDFYMGRTGQRLDLHDRVTDSLDSPG